MPIQKHVVHTRGLLRSEGSVDDGCDYRWTRDGQLIFYSKFKADDHVQIDTFIDGVLCERSTYITLESLADVPFRWTKRITQKFCE